MSGLNFKNNCDAWQTGLVVFIIINNNLILFFRTKQLADELGLTDNDVEKMEKMSENQRKVQSPTKL